MLDDRSKLYSAREVREMGQSARRIYGAPYPFPHPRAAFPETDDGKLKGIVTEHAVANMLNLLTYDYEDLYVFHSVGTYGEEQGETDNIVIYGNCYLIVEAKSLSKFDSVSINSEGQIYAKRGDAKRLLLGSHNNLLQKLESTKQRYPDATPHGLFVVRRADKTGSSYSSMVATTADNLLTDIQTLLDLCENRKSFSLRRNLPLLKETMELCIRHEHVPPFN
jgi:hypothetical protein